MAKRLCCTSIKKLSTLAQHAQHVLTWFFLVLPFSRLTLL